MTQSFDAINATNTRYVEQRFGDYLRDPDSVSQAWQDLFGEWEKAGAGAMANVNHRRRSIFDPVGENQDSVRLNLGVNGLVQAFRTRGHLAAKLDPLGRSQPTPIELSLHTHGLNDADLHRQCDGRVWNMANGKTLRNVVDQLQDTYCRYIGVQFMHIDDAKERDWLQQRMEASRNRVALSRETQLRILTRLTNAVIFEKFVRKKHVGAKTFSLEGAESLIPLLDLAIEKAARQDVDEIVIGMAHRGRLNVLANIIGKRPVEIFWEFDDPRPDLHRGKGDVKYHQGASGNWTAKDDRHVHLSLCFNPSHLEFVNPVALGRMRAKQDRAGDNNRTHGMTLLIHGDAGFAGEGVVQETFNLSELEDYATGGALHVIVNNQLGFTTPPSQGRSTVYATDIARMLQIPIFHVNGEHPEAVAQAVELAMDFRREFRRDVVIDMFSYRRWGHNETDEPSFTQPEMYEQIKHRESIRDGYLQHLLSLGEVTQEEADRIADEQREALIHEFEQSHDKKYDPEPHALTGVWDGYMGGDEPSDDCPETGVEEQTLRKLLTKLTTFPDDFQVHERLQRSIEKRRTMAANDEPLDWSTAEALAIGSLALEGRPIRLSGQDSQRGTFSQRHAVLHDTNNGSQLAIFQHLSDDQARVDVINSPLCETGCLGFEYGFSLDYPDALVMWEAQFGDFANAAQVVIDQFIASAEDKWRRLSGLVLLLPHGFEGLGPEHSSARIERFLSLAAEQNMQIVCPSTPAQYFHLLRRQVKRKWRKPLVVFTPKSLLRHPQVRSSLQDLTEGRFRSVLPDDREQSSNTEQIIMCSGKVYYDLREAREEHDRYETAMIRLEQFYPLYVDALHEALEPFPNETPIVWVQEEPINMGAWRFLQSRFGANINDHSLNVVARPESASPATGSKASHKREQTELINNALGLDS